MSAPSEPASRREIRAWALYDFANSAFATTILAVVFQLYFIHALDAGESRWGYAVSISMVISAIIAPVLGAICDYTASKKRALLILWGLGCAATMLLGIPNGWLAAAGLFILANLGFEAGSAVYNGFLPEIAPGESASRISAIGWACGYIGGALHLLLALVAIKFPQVIGLDPGASTRVAISSVGLWWCLFSLPMFLWLRERAVPQPLPPGDSLLRAGFRKVSTTIRNIRRLPTLTRFTIAYLVFNDGVQTVIVMAANFGSKPPIGMTQDQLIVCFLMIQGVAAVGSLIFMFLSRRLGDKRALTVSLFIWCAVIAWAFVIHRQFEFWILGVAVGLVMGGTQAIARSILSRFTPPSSAAEFFGFYSITGKVASAMGPALYATVFVLTKSSQWSVLSVGIFFVAGLIILRPVEEAKGIAEAEIEEKRLTAGAEGAQV